MNLERFFIVGLCALGIWVLSGLIAYELVGQPVEWWAMSTEQALDYCGKAHEGDDSPLGFARCMDKWEATRGERNGTS